MPSLHKTTPTQILNQSKVAIYIRVSTHWQVDKDSLQVQNRELSAYSEMILGIKDYVVFEDPGYSAKNTDRPAYQMMMDRLRSGEFSHLLVWKIDRISRNLLDFAQMYSELKSLGITFVSKNEQFDTSTAIGEAMLKIILVFAELERNMTSERVSAVMLSRASNGQWNGGHVPFGYDYDKKNKELSINPAEASVIQDMYNKYEQYQSTLYVSRYLNKAGIKTKAGNTWSPVSVHKILTSEFYIGVYRYNQRKGPPNWELKNQDDWIVVENHHPPIISQEQFEHVRFLLSRNKRGGNQKGITPLKKNIHVFSGLLQCGQCGGNMSATIDRARASGWRPSIYACHKRRGNGACSNKYVSDIYLGPFVFNYISNILRAKSNSTSNTSAETLERKLLRGLPASTNIHIERSGIEQLLEIFQSGETVFEYRPSSVYNSSNISVDERQVLKERKLKEENALARLTRLYLYGDGGISEKDFIIEKKKITDAIAEIDSRLNALPAGNSDDLIMSDSFIEKASYFLMVSKLLEDRYVDYEKHIRNIDPATMRAFLRTVVETIEISDGKVQTIVFKNGMTHRFLYKNKTEL